VRALVLGCTSPGGRHSIDRSGDVRRSLVQPPAEARQALLELMYTPAWLATHPGPYHTLGDRSMPPHARRGHLRASDGHDAWDAMPGIVAPTLVLHGTDDLLNPTANAPLLAGLPAGADPGRPSRLLRGAPRPRRPAGPRIPRIPLIPRIPRPERAPRRAAPVSYPWAGSTCSGRVERQSALAE
jgi:hypothetical protein